MTLSNYQRHGSHLPGRALAGRSCLGVVFAIVTALPGTAALAEMLQAEDIAPFEVVYNVGNNVIMAGSATLALEQEGERWRYELSTRPTGVFKLTGRGRISETSIFDVVAIEGGAEIRPRSYSFRQDEERQRSVDALFDWNAGSLEFQRRGKNATVALDSPVHDRLSVTLAVMNALRHDVEQAEFKVFDNGKLKNMRFTNEGLEVLDTSMGKIETLRVKGENADGSSRTSITWFAPSFDYVPIQLEQRKRGKLVARMSLSKLSNRVGEIELESIEVEAEK